MLFQVSDLKHFRSIGFKQQSVECNDSFKCYKSQCKGLKSNVIEYNVEYQMKQCKAKRNSCQ